MTQAIFIALYKLFITLCSCYHFSILLQPREVADNLFVYLLCTVQITVASYV